MADSVMSYAITAGIFAFLAAVLFTARARRHHSGWTPEATTTESG
ncbi:MAG TPA: hypothetical protein VGQ03_10815 [Nitrososphaera sp.]|nr:hypothetical protein [Nitrososphaera sp.]